MRTDLSANFETLNNAGSKKRAVLVQVQDDIVAAEERLQADWQANTGELQVDYTNPPVSGEVMLDGFPVDVWDALSPSGTPPSLRSAHSSAEYDGKIYTFGGQAFTTYYNDLHCYDIATNAWSTLSPSGTPPAIRSNHSACIYGSKMYIFGGSVLGPPIYNDLHCYDIATNAWSTLSPSGTPPAERRGHSACIYGTKMYVFGGDDPYIMSTYYSDILSYDIATNAWATLTSASAVKAEHSAVLFNDRILHFGGWNGITRSNEIVEYNITTDSWSTRASGATTRREHSAVIIASKMYVFGGRDAAAIYLQDVWEYSYHDDAWTQLTSGASIRSNHTAIEYQGLMYVFAGRNQVANLNDLYSYGIGYYSSGHIYTDVMDLGSIPTVDGEWQIGDDKPTGTGLTYEAWASTGPIFEIWIEHTSGATARIYHTSVESGGKVYVFGGDDGTSYLNDLWEYDLSTHTWTLLSPSGTPPIGRGGHSAVVSGGKMYIFGGWNGTTYYNDIHEYDISGNSWSSLTSGATIRKDHSAIVYSGKIYIFGGFSGTAFLNDLYEYDITGDTWTPLTSGATIRQFHSGIESGGNMYVFGGSSTGPYKNDVWEYSISGDSWTSKTSGATILRSHIAIESGGKMYVFGGNDGTSYVNDTWEYNIAGDSWVSKTSGATARTGHSAIEYSGKMYIFGGWNGSSYLNDLWSYGLPAYTTTSLGTIADGDAITTLNRYYMVKATFAANTARDSTPILQSIRADFSTYIDFIHHNEPGKISGLSSISTLSTSIDDFEDSAIGAMTITLPFAARISKWMAERAPRNRIVKVKYGFIDPIFTDADYLDAFYGQIETATIGADNKVKLTVKSFHKEWKVQVPEKWESASDDVTWTNVHHIDVMLDIISNYLSYRDSKIDYTSFYAVRDALPGWKVTRKITGDPLEAKALLEELRRLVSCYFILEGDGRVSLKKWDATESAVASLSDADFLTGAAFDGNSKSLIITNLTYYDYKVSATGEKASDFNELDAPVPDSAAIANWNENGYNIEKDKWTDVADASQVAARRDSVLARYEPPPPILMGTIAAKHIAKEEGDIINITTKRYPSIDFTGCTDKPFQIVKITPDWMNSKINLTLLEV